MAPLSGTLLTSAPMKRSCEWDHLVEVKVASMRISRRGLLASLSSLGGVALMPRAARAEDVDVPVNPAEVYAPIQSEPFPVPAINIGRVGPRFLRQVVNYDSSEQPGTIIIDPNDHFLYLTDGQGGAIRYGVGVGRQGFAWAGTALIHDKREWPDWYPPKEMIARDPSIKAEMATLQSGIGMHGGPGNPLGARAMYLFQGNRDTLYRIHGTVEPYTIGSSISSGCIRMINQDVIDLYSRVSVGTTVQVLASRSRAMGRPVSRYPVPDEPIDGYQPDDADSN